MTALGGTRARKKVWATGRVIVLSLSPTAEVPKTGVSLSYFYPVKASVLPSIFRRICTSRPPHRQRIKKRVRASYRPPEAQLG